MTSLATKIKDLRADEILVWNIIATNCAFGFRNAENKSHKNQAIEMIRIADPSIRMLAVQFPLYGSVVFLNL